MTDKLPAGIYPLQIRHFILLLLQIYQLRLQVKVMQKARSSRLVLCPQLALAHDLLFHISPHGHRGTLAIIPQLKW